MTTFQWNGTGFPRTIKFTHDDADDIVALSTDSIQVLTTDQIQALFSQDLNCNNFQLPIEEKAYVPDLKSEPLNTREIMELWKDFELEKKIPYLQFAAIISIIEEKHGIR